VVWSGTAATVPQGWALCDGTNGTPDLRDRFILGAGGAEAPGQSAAGDAINHSISAMNPPNGFSFTLSSVADHGHGLPSYWYQRNLSCGIWAGIDTANDVSATTSFAGSGGHDHTLGMSFPSLWSDPQVSGRPPWFALCYIMCVATA